MLWLKDYLKDVMVVNGTPSDKATVSAGIPQGSVLGPTLFSLYINSLPGATKYATTFMYADDTTIYCNGDSVDGVIYSYAQHGPCEINYMV